METDLVEVAAKQTTRRNLRRQSDVLVQNLHKRMGAKATVLEGLREVLHVLREASFVAPRIYRKREEECILVAGLDLPVQFENQETKFDVSHPILEEIIQNDQVYRNDNIQSNPSLIWGPKDPLYHIKEPGLIGVPYVGNSSIYPKEIKGLIIVNYDPLRKKVDDSVLQTLDQVGWVVGSNVARLLEIRLFKRKEEELQAVNGQLEEQVKKDGPTGLYNKKKFHEDLDEYLRQVKAGKKYSLILVDCDRLKDLNDTLGHAKGDEFLSKVGSYLASIENTVGYRFGGDEFAVVLQPIQKTEALHVAEKIRHAFKEFDLPDADFKMTASIGVMRAHERMANGSEWYRAADVALYSAKRQRDCIIFV
jgi:diguanylate cyclase (GGDEF)-like protein